MKKNQEWGTALLRRAHHRKEKTYGRTILTAKDLKFRYDPEQPDYALNGRVG